MSANRRLSGFDRSLAALLFLLLVVGAFGLWIGVPVAILWGLGKLVDEPAQHLVLALLAVPAGMMLFALLLTRLNSVYLRVSGFEIAGEEGEWAPRLRGPLDRILVACSVIALVALMAAMFFGEASTGRAAFW